MKSFIKTTNRFKASVCDGLLKLTVMAQVAFFSSTVFAQADDRLKLPEVKVPGVDGKTDGGDILFGIIKWIGIAVVWVLIAFAALVMLKNILGSLAKKRKDADVVWGEIAMDLVGNVLALVVMLVLGAWVTSFFA